MSKLIKTGTSLPKNTILIFVLKLNIETWGRYKKGDKETFNINLLNNKCGLVRFPIDKRWDIVSCKIADND